MAAATTAHGGHLATRLRPSTRRRPPMPLQVTAKVNFITSSPPIFISTNLAHINPHHLKELYVLCNHSSHRFPNVDSVGRVEPIDFVKFCTAVSHSSVVVSAFTKPEFFTPGSSSGEVVSKINGIGGDWIKKMTPVTPENGRLIGFGRAVSDCGLTASIYDVMVHPALQGRGIGRMIVQRIIRKLTSIGVYDIAALCSDKERLFFGACGFGDDTLKSKTMMYTRTPISPSIEEQAIVAGTKQMSEYTQEEMLVDHGLPSWLDRALVSVLRNLMHSCCTINPPLAGSKLHLWKLMVDSTGKGSNA